MQKYLPGVMRADPLPASMTGSWASTSSHMPRSCCADTMPWPGMTVGSPTMSGWLGTDFPPAWLINMPSAANMPLVTSALLQGVMPMLTRARAENFSASLNGSFARYSINTPKRIAAFLGQIAVESNQMRHLEEQLSYHSASRLKATFPSKFKTVDASGYTRNAEKLANYVYADRLGNGDTASGDGWKYRGRGLIQLTGKSNYQRFKDASRVDVITHPELLLEPRFASLSACWFWNQMALNDWADKGNYRVLTKRINHAMLEFKERETFRKRALFLLLVGATTRL